MSGDLFTFARGQRCASCGRKQAVNLSATYAERDGETVQLDGHTCGICLRAAGWGPAVG